MAEWFKMRCNFPFFEQVKTVIERCLSRVRFVCLRVGSNYMLSVIEKRIKFPSLHIRLLFVKRNQTV